MRFAKLILTVAAILFVAFQGGAVHAQFDAELADTLSVEVRTHFRSGGNAVHSGIVVADGKVLTITTAYGRFDRLITVVGADGVEREAVRLEDTEGGGLGLLEVPGLTGAAYTIADTMPDVDLEVHATGRVDGLFVVANGAMRTSPDRAAGGVLHHTAEYSNGLLGGPVFDRCGRLIGISTPTADADHNSLRRGEGVPAQFRQMRSVQSLSGLLDVAGAEPAHAAGACLPVARQEEAEARQRAEAAAEEAERRRLEAEAAEQEAARRRAEAEAARDRSEAEAEAARQAAEEATADAELRRREAEEAAQAATQALEDLQGVEAEAVRQNDRWRLILAIAVGAAIIILGISGVVFAMRLSRQRSVAAAAAREAAALRDEIITPFRDCILVSRSQPPVVLPGRLLPEAAGGVLLGRHPGIADAVVASEDVSRRHARIFERNGQLFLTDLGSSNGTFVDGHRLRVEETVAINEGQEIGFADHRYALRMKR